MEFFKPLLRIIADGFEDFRINFYRKRSSTGLTRNEDIEAPLLRIRPQDNGHDLIRVGGSGDGGYLIPDDLAGISECFSPGSNKLSNFESEVASRWHIKSVICDSVDEKPSDLTAFQDFTDAWVGPASDDEKYNSLTDWVEEKSKSGDDFMLQMDIESAEFLTVLATSRQLLKRFRIIVIELHFLEAVKNNWAFEQIYTPFFYKILGDFDPVYLHPNSCCGTWNLGDFEFPRIVELTLHRKDRGKRLHARLTSRNHLDEASVKSNPDICLVFSQIDNHISVKWE